MVLTSQGVNTLGHMAVDIEALDIQVPKLEMQSEIGYPNDDTRRRSRLESVVMGSSSRIVGYPSLSRVTGLGVANGDQLFSPIAKNQQLS